MKRIIEWTFLMVMFAACSGQPETGGYVVRGVAQHMSGQVISLSELTPKGLILMDTARVNADGSFEIRGHASEKTFCTLNLTNGNILLVLDTASEIFCTADANDPEHYGIKGSPDSEELRRLLEINNRYIRQIKGIESRYAAASGDVPSVQQQDQIRHEYDSIMNNRKTELEQYVLSHTSSIIPYFATNFLMPEGDFSFLEEVDRTMFSKFDQSKYAHDHHARVEKLRRTAIGLAAPDIVLPDPFGKTIALSSFRGKYVLVDFWASWCRPCREESPNLIRLYNRFKGFGFEIFSVSLDDNKDAWMKAINDDKLLWNHVSDLMKWNSSVVEQYNIESIPFTVLLNKDGKILAKNLRGEALAARVEEAMKNGE